LTYKVAVAAIVVSAPTLLPIVFSPLGGLFPFYYAEMHTGVPWLAWFAAYTAVLVPLVMYLMSRIRWFK